jgi:hypothetical protein
LYELLIGAGWFINGYQSKKACDIDLKNIKLEQAKHNSLILVIYFWQLCK